MQKVILATSNQGKVKEFQELFFSSGFDLIAASHWIDNFQLPEEKGTTFAENALLKASFIANLTSEIVIADDSGLSVDYLEGAPGVFSARFAGENSSDAENNAKLLQELNGVPIEARLAKFVCAIAIAQKDLDSLIFIGECPGHIAINPTGEGGFGYDPLFIESSTGKSFAELPLEQKNSLSHRGIAISKALMYLKGCNQC
jgi:XTP/dITP diphosphohydrolase